MERSIRRGWHVGWWGSALAVMLGALAGPAAAEIVELSGCDSIVTAEVSRYQLIADVDCSDEDGRVLTIPHSGVLDLGEHTIRGVAVSCNGSCRIIGPGTIDGGSVTGTARVLLRRVTMIGSPGVGVLVRHHRGLGRVTIIDSTITGSAGNGVEFDRRATIVRSSVSGNGQHGVAVSMRAGNQCARGRISAKASTFVDNGRDGDCGASEVCADLATCTRREAHLDTSTCQHSRQLGSGIPGTSCGVCDFD